MSEDIKPEIIKNTQKTLGKYIKKPVLTEKLLKKPPFRFLHDIIKAVINETGFLKGLFSEHELNSDNVKDKDSKINFLNKLIDAVKNLTDADFNVRAGKIVAGLEPENTNLLLQAIGKAISSKVDSSEYVKKINFPQEIKAGDNKNTVNKTSELKNNKTAITKEVASKPSKTKLKTVETPKTKLKTVETPKSKRSSSKDSPKLKTDTIKSKERKEKERKITQDAQNVIEKQDILPEEIIKDGLDEVKEIESPKDEIDVKNDVNNKGLPILVENKELPSNIESEREKEPENTEVKKEKNVPKSANVRPKSARPKSGEKDKGKSEEIAPLEMKVSSSVQRPKSSLRPPSVRPSSARPGAPRLRPDSALPSKEPVLMGNINVIVEAVDNADEEETVIIENDPEAVEDTTAIDIQLKNKGHLVEQILEQIKEGDKMAQGVEVDWETNASQIKEGSSKELSQLRTQIQNLTKAANPLGKLMNYLHEDLDAMYSELQTWANTKKQLYAEIQKQKRQIVESEKPLLSRLAKLDEDIKKQQQEITNVRSNILRSDMRIKELLSK